MGRPRTFRSRRSPGQIGGTALIGRLAFRLGSSAVLAGSVALVAACVDPKPSSPTAEDLRDIDLSPDHTITVDEDGFHPASLEITSGEVVLFVNEGTERHSFTAEERFDTGRLEPGDDVTVVLTEPGEIPYRDLEEPDHEATLTIVPGPTDEG